MKKLVVKLLEPPSVNYSIFVDQPLGDFIKSVVPRNTSKLIIITDHIVKKYYLNEVCAEFKKQGFSVQALFIKSGEESKNFEAVKRLHEKMFKIQCDRETLIVALGGGVVGDLAGFVAATYMRGIAYIQMPTSLLAMTDSSVGGKTGINTSYGKNLVGSFWQPKSVYIATNFLETLPKKHFINGLMEAIKIFLTCDAKSFYFVEKNLDKIIDRDQKFVLRIISRAIQLKINIVVKDEKEKSLRAILNFGHTIGHAIEKVTSYHLLHGYAVGYGVLVESQIAVKLNLLSEDKFVVISNLLKRLGISKPSFKLIKLGEILQAAKNDKKNSNQKISFVLLSDIGSVWVDRLRFVHAVPTNYVKQAWITVFGVG